MTAFNALLNDIHQCQFCAEKLPLDPRPVLQCHPSARILIAAQAPGRKVHETGIPFNDASGDRLRAWLGLSREVFYDERKVAILPMGFCYPGTSKSGDLPPRPECAPLWREAVMSHFENLQLTLVIGQYAQQYHLSGSYKTLTERVLAWRDNWPHIVPMPHPSPRNNRWLKQNSWFEETVLPELRQRVDMVLSASE